MTWPPLIPWALAVDGMRARRHLKPVWTLKDSVVSADLREQDGESQPDWKEEKLGLSAGRPQREGGGWRRGHCPSRPPEAPLPTPSLVKHACLLGTTLSLVLSQLAPGFVSGPLVDNPEIILICGGTCLLQRSR